MKFNIEDFQPTITESLLKDDSDFANKTTQLRTQKNPECNEICIIQLTRNMNIKKN